MLNKEEEEERVWRLAEDRTCSHSSHGVSPHLTVLRDCNMSGCGALLSGMSPQHEGCVTCVQCCFCGMSCSASACTFYQAALIML